MADGIIVIGAGGFGRETLDVIEAINAVTRDPVWDVIGVVDDGPAEIQIERLRDREIRLLGGIDANRELFDGTYYVVGIGAPDVRASLAAKVEAWGAKPATLVHPSAVVGTRVVLAAGTVVCGGAQISTNVRLGRHAHVNPGAIIGHDSDLADFVSVNPGATISGEVSVRSRSLIGARATILQGLEIGSETIIGAAACVTRSVPSGVTVVGVPARDIGTRS